MIVRKFFITSKQEITCDSFDVTCLIVSIATAIKKVV